MEVTVSQLKGKPKKVGEMDGMPVMSAETKGGLFLLMTLSKGKPLTLGTGSHPGIAAHIAERDFPNLKMTELSKAESLDPQILRREVPIFTELTRRFQALDK